MRYFSIHTLGCKLNQLEGEAVAEAFHREGFSVIPWEEDSPPGPSRRLMLLNTCTVTSMAEQKARRLIRAALRKGALVLVTGCYAQLNAGELSALDEGTPGEGAAGERSPGRLFIISGDKKSALLDLPRYLAGEEGEIAARIRDWLSGAAVPPDAGLDRRFRFAPLEFSTHTRGFLKIQDGCNRHCTYCRVRLARGESVSLPPEEVLGRLRALEKAGYAEAVLTGVNISCYASRDMDLGGLLNLLLGGTERIRLRLSSLEPDEIGDSLLRSLADVRLRPHFHLSVQSGSTRILERMGRSYGPETVERAVARLRRLRGDPFVACDIIVGFPGEGEDDFKETLALCERADFAWIHVFPYSPRPGTPAWNFRGRLPQRELSARAARLAELARRGRRNYVGRWIGREVELVPETRVPARLLPDRAEGFCAATSENYLKLLVPRRPPGGDPNAVPRCRIREIPRRAGNASGPFSPNSPGSGFDALGEP